MIGLTIPQSLVYLSLGRLSPKLTITIKAGGRSWPTSPPTGSSSKYCGVNSFVMLYGSMVATCFGRWGIQHVVFGQIISLKHGGETVNLRRCQYA